VKNTFADRISVEFCKSSARWALSQCKECTEELCSEFISSKNHLRILDTLPGGH
jgi:hypothetical protein